MDRRWTGSSLYLRLHPNVRDKLKTEVDKESYTRSSGSLLDWVGSLYKNFRRVRNPSPGTCPRGLDRSSRPRTGRSPPRCLTVPPRPLTSPRPDPGCPCVVPPCLGDDPGESGATPQVTHSSPSYPDTDPLSPRKPSTRPRLQSSGFVIGTKTVNTSNSYHKFDYSINPTVEISTVTYYL